MQRIKLPEHYSSRLLFVDDKNIPDPSNFKLEIEDTTSGQTGHDEMDNSEYPNNFLLGKLTNNIWYLEDSGIYDSNHEHTAEIYNENDGVRNTLYNVTRIMEYLTLNLWSWELEIWLMTIVLFRLLNLNLM